MSRVNSLTEKNMDVLREMDATRVQAKKTSAVLKDYSLQHRVTMQWDMNSDSTKDQMFKLTVGGNTVVLDWEEFQRYGRWI